MTYRHPSWRDFFDQRFPTPKPNRDLETLVKQAERELESLLVMA